MLNLRTGSLVRLEKGDSQADEKGVEGREDGEEEDEDETKGGGRERGETEGEKEGKKGLNIRHRDSTGGSISRGNDLSMYIDGEALSHSLSRTRAYKGSEEGIGAVVGGVEVEVLVVVDSFPRFFFPLSQWEKEKKNNTRTRGVEERGIEAH